MGSIVLHFTPHIAAPSSPPPAAARRFSATRCRFSARYGGRSGGSQWDRAKEQQPKFGEEYRTFGDNNGSKQRVWWSDDESSWDDDDDDDDGFGPFGVLDDSIGFGWIFKLVQAFGWMVPAIIISMLLGTGTNTFIMAMTLPLAQSAISLVLETFWERPSDSSRARPKSKTKKRPFTRPANNSATREREENDTRTSKNVEDYQSWVAANYVSGEKKESSAQSFGGWDDLDKQGRVNEVPKSTPLQNANEPRKQKKSKLSRRVRKRDSPLLIRLLIAVFPFFGFWTKLM